MGKRRTKKIRRDFYVYYLRRPDKDDPIDLELLQPFYVGRGQGKRVYDHRKEALFLYHKEGQKTIKINIIHGLWNRSLDFIEEIMFVGLTTEEANDIEMSAIAFYGRIDLGTGCLANHTEGGDGVTGISEEARKNLSERQMDEKNHMYGKTQTEEHRYKNSKANSGENNHFYNKHHTEESIRKISEAKKGKPLSEEHREKLKRIRKENPSHCKPHTEETKRKISKSKKGNSPAHNKGKPMSEEQKEILRIANIGRVRSEESKQKQSESTTGEKNHNWSSRWVKNIEENKCKMIKGEEVEEFLNQNPDWSMGKVFLKRKRSLK